MTDNSKFPKKEHDLLKQFEAAVKAKTSISKQADMPSNLISKINIHFSGYGHTDNGHTDVQHIDNHVDVGHRKLPTCKLK